MGWRFRLSGSSVWGRRLMVLMSTIISVVKEVKGTFLCLDYIKDGCMRVGK